MKLIHLFPAVLIFLGMSACVKEEINLDDLSTEVGITRDIAMPLLKSSIAFEDVAGTAFDSLLIDGEDTVKLFLIQDITYIDTLPLGDLGEEYTFEYLNLHHGFTNMFPVGLDVEFYLYDSLISSNIDTIFLSNTPGEPLLIPAPVDEDGFVIEEDVTRESGIAAPDDDTIDRLMNDATHLVFSIRVPSTNDFVKILDHYSLSVRLGIEARGYYETDLNSEE